MRGVAPGEAALDAGMAVIRLAVLAGHHADDGLALHFGLEAAADAAIGAGGDDGMLRLADFDDRLLDQRPVGQACTQAPQETHSLVKNGSSRRRRPAIRKPRPSMVSARCPARRRRRARSANRRCTSRDRTRNTGSSRQRARCRWLGPDGP